ncbi:hypothetical protein Nepgr_033769 [Nepenthes gracilis]|uniref:Uncharacterized protein n=1 Tax=Nepenthes gracilis TaxID=150966 RepID=A0AAD3TL09_NEPGR|nr:hypothetical protein Nepgr_033769 [Nepenthes gracilis]
MPSKNKPTRCQIPVAPVDIVRMGKGHWRFKSKSLPGVESAGPVRESNSFAALQCLEEDALIDPAHGVMKRDALGFSEPDLSSTLNGEEANLRILTPSELEWENRGAPPLDNEGPFQVGSNRSLSGCKGGVMQMDLTVEACADEPSKAGCPTDPQSLDMAALPVNDSVAGLLPWPLAIPDVQTPEIVQAAGDPGQDKTTDPIWVHEMPKRIGQLVPKTAKAVTNPVFQQQKTKIVL